MRTNMSELGPTRLGARGILVKKSEKKYMFLSNKSVGSNETYGGHLDGGICWSVVYKSLYDECFHGPTLSVPMGVFIIYLAFAMF